ncbi:hypothetical protein [Vibrio chagasii]|uniref:hypothetical protein n=1 Tax=Vibrio chagasii TaxID=170679 RepID=UPI00228507A9|nr:hypothetical protein [Vibrio chagasii]MCY9828831.1 hypothetical protein [Vibrio chagasii]
MQIAKRQYCPTVKSLKTHQKAHSAPFERLEHSEEGTVRYYSDSPAFALGEAVLSALSVEGESLPRVVALVPHPHDETTWSGIELLDGRVNKEVTGTLTDFTRDLAYECHHATRVLVMGEEAPEVPFFKDKQVLVPMLTSEQQQAFSLSPVKRPPYKTMLCVMGLISILGGVGTYALKPKPSPPIQPTVKAVTLSPQAKFEANFPNQYLVSDAIKQMLVGMVNTQMMPEPITASGATWADGLVTVPLTGKVTPKIARYWRELNPNKAPYWHHGEVTIGDDGKPKAADDTIERPTRHAGEFERYDLTEFSEDLLFYLMLLEAQDVQKTQSKTGDLSLITLEFKMVGEAGKLLFLGDVLDQPFITLNTLNMTWESDMDMTVTLSLTMVGVINE